MGDTKHTPGPWTAIEGDDNGGSEDDAPIWGTVRGDDWHICRIWSDQPNAEANAHLIASAPELLTALCDVLAWCESDLQVETGVVSQQVSRERVETVRAALAKAKGGA